jgi:hypothetical protein
MSDNEYLARVVVRERLREAHARAAVHRLIEGTRASGTAGVGRSTRRRSPGRVRAYWAAASSLISRCRNWRPA